MAGQNLATLTNLLKEFYGPGITESLVQESPFFQKLQKGSGFTVIDGNEFVIPVHLKRNTGVGARPEMGVLPTAGNQGYQSFKQQVVYNYGKIQVTGQSIKQTKTDKGAFGRVLPIEMDGLKNDLKRELNWQFIHNGAAPRGSIAAGVASATQTVSPVYADILQENMLVDIYSPDFVTPRATGVTINSVNLDYTTWNVTSVTLSQSVTTTTGDVIVRSGNHGYEIVGLDGIVGNGNAYGNINGATNAFWNSPVLTNGGTLRPITEDLWQRGVDAAGRAGGNPTFWMSTRNVRRNFFNQLSTAKRTVNTKDYEGGFTSVTFDGKEIFIDDMCPANTMYGIDPTYLKIYETDQMGWMDDDGDILHRNLDGSDGVYAVHRWYSNLGCNKRTSTVKIGDLSEN